MDSERGIPDDPVGFIRQCVKERRIFWTYHVNMRLKNRSISRDSVIQSTAEYEIIESYPTDKYLPSYLVWTRHEGDIFHVLFATDVENRNVRIVTAYKPDIYEWNDDLRRRNTK